MDVFGLIGNPVGHSLSPPMHEAAYDEYDIEARYVTFEPEPRDLDAAIAGADALGMVGLNVTIPFKQSAFEFCTPDDLAARIGAVNTLSFAQPADEDDAADDRSDDGPAGDRSDDTSTDGSAATENAAGEKSAGGSPTGGSAADGTPPVYGCNTDAIGARRALEEAGVTLEGQALIVGAGGAGRAIAVALADAGMAVDVANRTTETAREVATVLPDGIEASGYGLDSLPALAADADVLVNATSVGMETDESPVPAEALHADLAVLDAVYRPIETRLLRDAAVAGAETVDGAAMLLHQGAAAFELWTGKPAPTAAMGAALRARL